MACRGGGHSLLEESSFPRGGTEFLVHVDGPTPKDTSHLSYLYIQDLFIKLFLARTFVFVQFHLFSTSDFSYPIDSNRLFFSSSCSYAESTFSTL